MVYWKRACGRQNWDEKLVYCPIFLFSKLTCIWHTHPALVQAQEEGNSNVPAREEKSGLTIDDSIVKAYCDGFGSCLRHGTDRNGMVHPRSIA